MNGKYVGLLIPVLILLGACATRPIIETVPCPPRPLLEAITTEEQLAMDPAVVGKVAQNQLKLKTYAKKLEVRAGCDWG